MRTHRDIIRNGGGVAACAHRLSLAIPTVRSWYTRNSIPHDYWVRLSLLEIATVNDLAATAPMTRRQRKAA